MSVQLNPIFKMILIAVTSMCMLGENLQINSETRVGNVLKYPPFSPPFSPNYKPSNR